ncbi:zinc-binding dehydrogenase [Nocardia sp. CA-136227]|uniref:zinc-binding dehydrogenase n=1 Tax=Nocardia sp. CA-136227 TaxID=3239979 RepID=UPI003D993844
MSLYDRFESLIDPRHRTTLEELSDLFDAAESIGEEFMLGEWDGAHFGLGHPIEQQLDAMLWAGKSFKDADTVSPIVCFDPAGKRFPNPIFGGATLRRVVYRGAATATMIYDERPMFDHFRRIDGDTVIGAMVAKGRSRPGYFYLTRTPAAEQDTAGGDQEAAAAKTAASPSPATAELHTRPRFQRQRPELLTRAALIRTPGGPFSIEDVELEAPRPDEVVVRMAASGLCHTDLTVAGMHVAGQPPIVLGHEGAGTVAAIGGEVRGLAVGDRVVMSYAWCGRCRNCERKRMAYCTEAGALNLMGVRADGSTGMRAVDGDVRGRFCGQSALSGYALALAHTVVPVDNDVPFEVLAPLGCGVLTGAGTVLNSLRPEPGSALAVFGAGSVGLSAVLAARVAGCTDIVAVDPLPARRELALSLGATAAFDPAEAKDAIRSSLGGIDYAIDCVGDPGVIRTALGVLRSPGMCATVGVRGRANPLEIDQTKLVGKGQTIRGVVEGDAEPATFIPLLIELYRAGRFPLDRMITTFPFDKIHDAVAATQDGTAVKAVLTFGDHSGRQS